MRMPMLALALTVFSASHAVADDPKFGGWPDTVLKDTAHTIFVRATNAEGKKLVQEACPVVYIRPVDSSDPNSWAEPTKVNDISAGYFSNEIPVLADTGKYGIYCGTKPGGTKTAPAMDADPLFTYEVTTEGSPAWKLYQARVSVESLSTRLKRLENAMTGVKAKLGDGDKSVAAMIDEKIAPINATLATKASQTDLDALKGLVATKADKSYVDDEIAKKANKADLEATDEKVKMLSTAFNNNANATKTLFNQNAVALETAAARAGKKVRTGRTLWLSKRESDPAARKSLMSAATQSRQSGNLIQAADGSTNIPKQ